MRKTKRKGIGGFVILMIYSVVTTFSVLVIFYTYVSTLDNIAATASHGENITHSAMLDFTMLNTNFINKGNVSSKTLVCAKNTFLPIKYVMGIGLLKGSPNTFNVGYRGHQETVEMESCMSPFFTSLGYILEVINAIINFIAPAASHIFLFTPLDIIPQVGQAETYVSYLGTQHYNTPGIIATFWKFTIPNNMKIKHPKTTYAYITLPNEEIATVVTKTN
ncbi:MAG: hypothetical protein KAR87_05695 [Candidatus Aenigmarchaeota archaeon]|nr:hypothetical protein [Candidatus Aenigmarchaeota archaeon]